MPTAAKSYRFLLTTWEGGGSVPPMVSVARKLIAAGHSVRLMSDACNRRDAEAAGAVFVPWTQAPSRAGRSAQDDPVKDWLARDPLEGFVKMLDGVVAGPALAYARDVQAELDREGADLVVSSELLLGVAAGCEARGQRFAPAELPENLHYIGPQLDLPEWAEGAAPPPSMGDRPLVAICFSTTFQNHAALLQTVMDALADRPVQAVATLGPALTDSGLNPPANVTLVAAADHDALMSRAGCVITHGGHGTVVRALSHGRPLLVLPLGRDQVDNAVRVTARGAGLALAPDATSAQIGEATARLINEPQFARAAGELGAVVTHDARTTPVVRILESLARGELQR